MVNEAGRPLKVFLCHTSGDKSAVRELYRRLVSEKWIEPWLDEENLLPGQDWKLEIEKALDNSDAVIVSLSTRSVSKEGYVQKELRFVLDIALEKPEGTIFILPVRLEDCKVPTRLNRWQWVDLFSPNGYENLMSSLRVGAEKLGVPLAIPRYVGKELEQRKEPIANKRLFILLVTFILAPDWEQSKRVVLQNEDLLSESTDEVFSEIISVQQERTIKLIYESHRDLLRLCKREGTESAFVEILSRATAVTPHRKSFLGPLSSLAESEQVERRLEIFYQTYRQLNRSQNPDVRGSIQRELGNYFAQVLVVNPPKYIQPAISAYEQALRMFEDRSPVDCAHVMRDIGVLYLDPKWSGSETKIEQAVEYFQRALELLHSEENSLDYGLVLHYLANAYVARPLGDRTQNIENAIRIYREVLNARYSERSVRTSTFLELAKAYLERPLGSRKANSQRAVETYRELVESLSISDITEKELEEIYRSLKSLSATDFAIAYRSLEFFKDDQEFLSHFRLTGVLYYMPPPLFDRRSSKLSQLEVTLKKTLEERQAEIETAEAYVHAHFKDHDSSKPLLINQVYVLKVAVNTSVPFDLEAVPITLPITVDEIVIDIIVSAEDMEISPNWMQTLRFKRSEEQAYVEFHLVPLVPGRKHVRLEFCYQMNWLAQIELEVQVEALITEPSES